jgi:hypothetical protein
LGNRRFLEVCRRNGFDCVDLMAPMKSYVDKECEALYLPLDRHLSPAGNDFVASLLLQHLTPHLTGGP